MSTSTRCHWLSLIPGIPQPFPPPGNWRLTLSDFFVLTRAAGGEGERRSTMSKPHTPKDDF